MYRYLLEIFLLGKCVYYYWIYYFGKEGGNFFDFLEDRVGESRNL